MNNITNCESCNKLLETINRLAKQKTELAKENGILQHKLSEAYLRQSELSDEPNLTKQK